MNSDFSHNNLFHQFEMELKADVSDIHLDYNRIEKQMFDKIEAADRDGLLSLLRLDEIPPRNLMESIEETVVKRIREHSEYEEPVDECIKIESDVPDMYWRHFYRGLERKVALVSKLSPFEQALKIEEILPIGRFEKVEEPLFERIANYEKAQTQNQRAVGFFWGIVREHYKRVGALALTLCAALGIWQGSLYYQSNFRPIASTLYQIQGPNIDLIKSTMPLKGLVSSEIGGSMTMINKYGYVELQNGSGLEILKASERKMHYKASFAGADKQLVGQGGITFFVNKQKKNEKFLVSTADYRIEVRGTYFKLQPDVKGHVAISVKEGQVKVVFQNGDIKILDAGQSLGYDLNYDSYYSTSGGPVVARQEIETFPNIQDLSEYQRIYITTSVPGADIRIDGRYVGMSPIFILQPQGYHAVSVEKHGYAVRDTSVMLGAGQPNMIAIDLQDIKAAVALPQLPAVIDSVKPIVSPVQKPTVQPSISKVTAPVAPDSAKIFFQEAGNSEASNWKEACRLYEKAMNDRNAPALLREAANFSFAKLLADHGADKTKAQEVFFNYLAMYPNGNFVGESWLRLAELEFGRDQDKAIDYYLKYFEKYPGHYRNAELQERVGLIYLQKKRYDDALGMFKSALSNIQGDDQGRKSKILANIYKTLKEKESAGQVRASGSDQNASAGQKR
jgi:TolA-binding protein